MNLKTIVTIVAVVVLLAGVSVNADTKTFQNGVSPDGTYAGTDDTYNLKSGVADNNYGASTGLRVDGDPTNGVEGDTLIRFDLSSLGGVTNLNITSATLTLRAYDNHRNRDNVIRLYEVKSANKDWVAGTSDAAIETDASCWNYEQYDASNPSPWAGGTNGCSVVGTDIETNDLCSTTITTTADTPYTWTITDADMLNTLEDWAKGTVDNAGMLLRSIGTTGDSSGYYSRTWFRSSDFVTASKRPKFEVTYTPEPATMVLLGLGGVGLLIRRRRRA